MQSILFRGFSVCVNVVYNPLVTTRPELNIKRAFLSHAPYECINQLKFKGFDQCITQLFLNPAIFFKQTNEHT